MQAREGVQTRAQTQNTKPHLLLFVALVVDITVDFHEDMKRVENEAIDGAVPVGLGRLVKRREDHGHERRSVLCNDGHEVLVVEEVDGALSNLKVVAGQASRQLSEQSPLHAAKRQPTRANMHTCV